MQQKYPSTLGPVCTIKSKAWDMKQYSVHFFIFFLLFFLNMLQTDSRHHKTQKLHPRNNTPGKKQG